MPYSTTLVIRQETKPKRHPQQLMSTALRDMIEHKGTHFSCPMKTVYASPSNISKTLYQLMDEHEAALPPQTPTSLYKPFSLEFNNLTQFSDDRPLQLSELMEATCSNFMIE